MYYILIGIQNIPTRNANRGSLRSPIYNFLNKCKEITSMFPKFCCAGL